jgi:hypothetical protein
MMRQVRVCVRETTRYRVFECLRCYAELMWAPELRRNEDVAVERGSSKVVPMISPTPTGSSSGYGAADQCNHRSLRLMSF